MPWNFSVVSHKKFRRLFDSIVSPILSLSLNTVPLDSSDPPPYDRCLSVLRYAGECCSGDGNESPNVFCSGTEGCCRNRREFSPRIVVMNTVILLSRKAFLETITRTPISSGTSVISFSLNPSNSGNKICRAISRPANKHTHVKILSRPVGFRFGGEGVFVEGFGGETWEKRKSWKTYP